MLPDRKTTTGPTKGIPHTVGLFQERNMRTKGRPSEGKPQKASESKPSEGKPNEGKPQKASQTKASEGKPSEGKPQKASESKPVIGQRTPSG